MFKKRMDVRVTDKDTKCFKGTYMVEYDDFTTTDKYLVDRQNFVRFIYSTSKQFELPNSITTIESESFKDVRNVEQVILPASLEKIEENAFKNCSDLRAVVSKEDDFENDLIIQSDAFNGCSSLETIYLKSTKTIVIEKDAFSDCQNLTAVILDCENVELRENAFSSSELTIYAKNDNKIKMYCERNDFIYKEI